MNKTCRGCGHAVGEKPESCWYCGADMCVDCWEEKGHCGHSEADAINEASKLTNWKGRAKIARALWPDAEHFTPLEDEDDN